MSKKYSKSFLRSVRVAILFALIISGTALSAFADTVTLKNGGKFEGKIIKQTPEEITISIGNSGTITIKMKSVADVKLGPVRKKPRKPLPTGETRQPQKPAEQDKVGNISEKKEEEKQSLLSYLLSAVIGILINGFFLWGVIGLVDPGNKKNKFLPAIGWSIIVTGANFVFPLFGLILAILVLLMILLHYYDISFLRSFLIIVLLFVINLVVPLLLLMLIASLVLFA